MVDRRWDKNSRFKHHVIIEAVVEMNKDGKTLGEIADYFNVSRDCIRNRFKKAGIKVINWIYDRNRGSKLSFETKRKIGLSNKKYRKNKTWAEIFGKEKAEELKKNWVKQQRKKFLDGFNPSSSKEAKKKISEKAKKRCKNPEYLKKILVYVGQNKQEKFIESLLYELGYNFKFVGDGKININGKCPDFILDDKIIEYFGSYWHEKKDEKEKILFFNKHGYKTLVIWDYELKNMEKLKSKIKEFGNG